jgi:TonB family protein
VQSKSGAFSVKPQAKKTDLKTHELKHKNRLKSLKSNLPPTGKKDEASLFSRLKPLDDKTLSKESVSSPFSKLQQRRLKIRNETLFKIVQQVRAEWQRPNKKMPQIFGTASLELNREGYLISVEILQSSGDVELDQSILDAVKRVQRFDIPYNSPDAYFYQSLRLNFSSNNERYDLLPFQNKK